MKVPYLSRCFITIPPISFSDAESVSGESATTMVIGCEVGSSSNEKMQNRNVFVLLRKKFSRSDRDHVIAARQALGLDSTKRSDPEDDAENSPAKRSRDIDCKGLRCQISSTNSLPPTNNKSDRIDKNMTDTVSLPPTSSTRRRLLSVDSSHSMMDESCSGQSILDELLMEVYKDPYEDFLHKLKSSKKMQDRIDEIEVDVLTQLPAIKTQLSPKRMRSRRRLTYHHTTSSPAIISTQSQSTSQRSFTRLENRDDESVKSPVEYKIPKSASRDNTAGGKKISSSSSVPGLRTYNSGVNARHITIEHRSACGREGPLKCSSVYSAPVKRRALVSNTESYHGRLEF